MIIAFRGTMPPGELAQIKDHVNPTKIVTIADSMRKNGYDGPPIAVAYLMREERPQVCIEDGVHRCRAAIIAGLPGVAVLGWSYHLPVPHGCTALTDAEVQEITTTSRERWMEMLRR